MKFALLTFSALIVLTISSCDKITEPESPNRTITVSTLHSDFDPYRLVLEHNNDTIAAWDTVGNISISINAVVGDVIAYTVATNTEFGLVVQMQSAPDTIPFLYVSLLVAGEEIAYGYGVVE